VTSNKLSYSKSDANIKGIDQLSLILPIQSELIRGELIKMVNEKYIPNSLKGMVPLDYVLDRYNASIQWINQHHHAVIGNGPYYLDEFNPSGGVVTLKAFRDDTYPIKTGQYSKFTSPPELKVQKVDVPKFIRIGQPFNFTLELSINNSTSDSNPFSGSIDYFVSDRNNKLVIGDELKINDNKNRNSLQNDTLVDHNAINAINVHLNSTQTSELIPGPSKLKLIITTQDSPKPTIHESTLIARP
jgi:peptide/nickel transport system substrate-binding protein